MALFRLRIFVLSSGKNLDICNISVITEDIYLKLGLVGHYEKGNLYQ